MQETHKAGPLKQQNKGHKRGRHRSNREVESANKGKVGVKTLTKRKNRNLSKDERVNRTKQIRKSKRDKALAAKRSIGTESKPPILVVVYSYSSEPLDSLVDLIKSCDGDAICNSTREGSFHIYIPRFKLRYEFISIPAGDLYALMDAVKVADIMLLNHPIALEQQELLENPLIESIFAHFLPTTVHVVNGLERVPVKRRHDVKKNLQKIINTKFPDEKLHIVDKEQDCLQLLHQVGNCKRKKIAYKKHRSQILAESFQFIPNDSGADTGKLIVSGYVRNKALSANGLVHIPGWGDFQMDLIESAPDLQAVSKSKDRKPGMDVEQSTIIQRSDILTQESLDTENIPDPMEGEQTWPTAEEIAAAQEAAQKKVTKRVVKGTSEYQSSWILEEGNVDEEDEIGENDTDKYDDKMNVEEEQANMSKFKQQRMNELFPDEVDTPVDVPAKVRFARYRGLKTFNFSSWDPKENLPSDYSRIFQFENFNRTRRRVLKMADDDEGADVGLFVRVHVKNVPKALADFFTENPKHPLVLFGILQHEQKMSVVNIVLKRHPLFTEPIESKERLVFHVGCRRFYCNPVFSAHTNGTKFKYERFLRTDEATVASVFAPITYAPASVSVYKEYEDGSTKLVATGSVLSVSPDRLVIKRSVLSGHPFKITGRHAVVRYMFYNRDDILWFKPVELRSNCEMLSGIKLVSSLLNSFKGRQCLGQRRSLARMLSDPENTGTRQDHINFDTLGTWDNRIDFPMLLTQSIKHGKPIPEICADHAGHATVIGRRETMEDRFKIKELEPNLLYFAVFDGHGGTLCADFCFEQMDLYIKFWLERGEKDLQVVLENSFIEVNNAFARFLLYNHPQHFESMSGTTATVCLLRNSNELVVGHLGDSRALICRNGQTMRLTADHTAHNTMEKERIVKSGGTITADSVGRMMVNRRLAMTRSIGDLDLKQYGVSALPETRSVEIKHGKDAFLVLMTDGITFVMSDQEVINAVNCCGQPNESAQFVVDQALNFACEDNATAIVVPFGAWGKYTSSTHRISCYSFGREISKSIRY
ncbi:Pre-rRNA-processing protein TSR1 -like protein [Halotydeus destructor]|nr:Pre-rRNA-processing protein TSR1 -like protein [Halotydeus destructor]